jgi:outer membrane protein assembly factor BamB
VLVPGGTAYLKQQTGWEKLTKPRPKNIDEWTHYLHDPSGNAVAHDTVVGPPRHLQWLGSPRWSRHHDRMASMSALVSSNGRLFYIMDEGSRVSIQLPPQWKLVARDAFNGTVLWKRDIGTWHSHLWPLKSGPTQLARRLICDGDTVYATLGLRDPLVALDAATGETLRTYDGTAAAEEVILSHGTLLVLANKGESELTDFAPQFNTGDQRRIAQEFRWNEKPRELLAIDPQSGRTLWKKETKVAPISLASDQDHVVFHDGDNVVCLSRTTGEEVWKAAQAPRRSSITMNFGPKLVLYEGVVLFAGGDRTMRAYDGKKGEVLWTAPHPQSGYLSPEDLLVVGGLVWSAPTTSTGDTGVYTGRDPRTGEAKIEFPPDLTTYWFHHRCYIAKATDNFLIPSRTGIEFVDYTKKDWIINHWVRGGCLYGVMPCNGLLYAPPHDCFCYPEAKLFGFNALAPATPSRQPPREVSDEGRLERGPAYGAEIVAGKPAKGDWPTYRGDAARSGSTDAPVSISLDQAWETKLGGRLSSAVVAQGRLLVAEIDAHTVHALDTATGKRLWSYTTGGRVDSPPTIHEGRVLFGSADGCVYCLRAGDGALVWRFRAAPLDQRLMSEEQLESVWPVHGNILVQDGVAYFVCGRSNFLDGGLRFFRLDPKTGEKLAEIVIDDRDPETGGDAQDGLKTLQMATGLSDILVGDGKYVYLRSQRFDKQGNREEIGPVSSNPVEQGGAQSGEGAHLFSPNGFLDSTWFHRAYWVFGKNFAGGHSGYYQAGRFAPAGQILAFDKDNVFGYGRKPEYLKWTTTMEYQLFATSKQAPDAAPAAGAAAGPGLIFVEKSESLNPARKALAVEAWIKAERPEGVVLARGGPASGYALAVRDGKPHFIVRTSNAQVTVAAGEADVLNKWTHLVGQLTKDGEVQLYVNGTLASAKQAPGLIPNDPAQAMEIGGDDKGAVGEYRSPLPFDGLIDEVRVYQGVLSGEEIAAHFNQPEKADAAAKLVLAMSFDDGQAADASGNKNDGRVQGVQPDKSGKAGGAMRFAAVAARGGNSFVKNYWNRDVPVLARGLVLAQDRLFVVGPPDLINEEETFQRLAARDPKVNESLQKQDEALAGKQGAKLLVISVSEGSTLAEYDLPMPAWDGLAAAGGKLYMVTADGKIICLAEKE